MKRKVFSNGPSLVVTLPSSWVKEYNIEQGNELNVFQHGNELKLFLDNGKKLNSSVINADGFDRTFLKCAIRNAYKKGYDDVQVKFSNSKIKYHRLNKIVDINDVVNQEVMNLIGFEVIEYTSNSIKISGFLKENKDDFDNFLRKIFLNLSIYAKDLKNLPYNENNLWEQSHWNIKKFINYCIRIINKQGLSSNCNSYFQIISGLDIILGILQHSGRFVLSEKIEYSHDTMETLKELCQIYDRFYDLFYKYSNEKIVDFGIERLKIIDRLNNINISSKELIFLDRVYQTIEVLYRLMEARMELE